MLAEGVMDQAKSVLETRLLNEAAELRQENVELNKEVRELRPLARLAQLLALMEGENQQLHKDVKCANNEWDEMKDWHRRLKLRIDELATEVETLKAARWSCEQGQ